MAQGQKSGFTWYELMTSDLDAAAAYYGKVVGWDVRDSGMPGMRYLIFGKGGKDVGGMMSWSSMGMDKPAGWKAHLHTTDVDADAAAVAASGGTVHREPQDIPDVGRFANVSDPQGAEYMLFQPAPGEQAPPRLGSNDPGNVGWNELSTTDWEAAWEFYSKHYGWEKETAVDMGPMGIYQTFHTAPGSAGGGMMTLPSFLLDKGMKPAWLYYFVVEDINAAAERVSGNGGTITHGPAQVPGGAWILQANDPQGGSFALSTANPAAA